MNEDLIKALRVAHQWMSYDREYYPPKDSPMVEFAGDEYGNKHKSLEFVEEVMKDNSIPVFEEPDPWADANRPNDEALA